MVARRPCQKCGLNRQEKFYTSPQGRICSTCRRKQTKRTARERRLVETYGITNEEYDTLLEAQGGACAICGGSRRYNLDIDHDHTTGLIRGLLCKTCNRHLLPAAQDTKEVLYSGYIYLAAHELNPVLGGRKVPE